jgi:hypothetical protein
MELLIALDVHACRHCAHRAMSSGPRDAPWSGLTEARLFQHDGLPLAVAALPPVCGHNSGVRIHSDDNDSLVQSPAAPSSQAALPPGTPGETPEQRARRLLHASSGQISDTYPKLQQCRRTAYQGMWKTNDDMLGSCPF